MSKILDYTPEELKAISECLQERYGEVIPTEQADIELRLDQYDSQVTECPAVDWEKMAAILLSPKPTKSNTSANSFTVKRTVRNRKTFLQ